ncbi:MAG: hypothetical protein LC808_26730 [Actinobacteria bacterium]|nr:hypothetical protein [Actinomycetota bacterium]
MSKGLRSNTVNLGCFTAQFANRNPPFPWRIPKEQLCRLPQLAVIKVIDSTAYQVIDGNHTILKISAAQARRLLQGRHVTIPKTPPSRTA